MYDFVIFQAGIYPFLYKKQTALYAQNEEFMSFYVWLYLKNIF